MSDFEAATFRSCQKKSIESTVYVLHWSAAAVAAAAAATELCVGYSLLHLRSVLLCSVVVVPRDDEIEEDCYLDELQDKSDRHKAGYLQRRHVLVIGC